MLLFPQGHFHNEVFRRNPLLNSDHLLHKKHHSFPTHIFSRENHLSLCPKGGIPLKSLTMEERSAQLKQWISEAQKRLEKAPPGKLSVSREHNRVYFYCKTAQGKEYLSVKNEELIRQLAQKAYDEEIVRAAQNELRYIDKQQSSLRRKPEDIYYKMPVERQALVDPIFLNDEDFLRQWKSQTFPVVNRRRKREEYRSKSGTIVRSKSELIIINAFEDENVPHFYEPPLKVGDELFFPDFLVLNTRTRKQYYWEHYGRMDDPAYADRTVWKINHYSQNGYCMGKELLCTFESSDSPLSTAQIHLLILKHLK